MSGAEFDGMERLPYVAGVVANLSAATEAHTTHVAHRPHMGQWQPSCDQCGDIGHGERYEQDAIAIAERHQQVGGFEKAPVLANDATEGEWLLRAYEAIDRPEWEEWGA